MSAVPPFASAVLEGLAKAMGDAARGLSGAEIGVTLAACRLDDPEPDQTKWKRLFNAWATKQNLCGSANHVVAFVHKSMAPARWIGRRAAHEALRSAINAALGFVGLMLHDDGAVRRAPRLQTLTDAEARADRLRPKLEARGVHPDVLAFCRAELLEQNYFHAVLEATKSIAEKIRRRTGLVNDGAELVQQAFALGSGAPKLAINQLATETDCGEQRGFMNLVVGLFGTFRNPVAHAPKVYYPINEQDALDILSLVSLVHRRVDAARTP